MIRESKNVFLNLPTISKCTSFISLKNELLITLSRGLKCCHCKIIQFQLEEDWKEKKAHY